MEMGEIALQSTGVKIWATFVALVLILPMVITVGAYRMAGTGGRPGAALMAAMGMLVFACAVLAVAMLRNSAGVHDGRLHIKSSFYSVDISLTDIGPEIDILDADAGKRIAWRTNGVGFPGYRSGWFRLNDGQSAFVAASGAANIYVPTKQGYAVMLAVKHPEKVRDQLIASAARGR
jgi:hypothetical protein